MNMTIFYAILIFVGVCVGIALAWFLVELVITLKKTRKKIDEVHAQLTPTIENIEAITAKVQPAIEKIDPLLERVSLSIDAANLELMRADQILENVNAITEDLSSATTAVGNIANAPAELLNKASKKIQGLFMGGSSNARIAGELNEANDVDQVIEQAKKQGKIFGRKVVKDDKPQGVNSEEKKSGFKNPFVSFK